jgi:2-C-methyl-D-erythritol 2,4-cyclodiphosphate synthase
MREVLAREMGITADRVSIKATTTEHLGFEGREEGVSAYAVVLVCKE